MRDEFSQKTKQILSQRVGHRCSNPNCLASTSGPQVNSSKAINIGVAAHITAASSGGPRFDSGQTTDQRQHPDNGIWLCQNCAWLIDSDEQAYPVDLLREWKRQAEARAILEIGQPIQANSKESFAVEEIELLTNAQEVGGLQILSNQARSWVRAGRKDFINPEDPAYAARYLDVLDSLLEKKLVKHDRGIWYPLTFAGFETVRKEQLH